MVLFWQFRPSFTCYLYLLGYARIKQGLGLLQCHSKWCEIIST